MTLNPEQKQAVAAWVAAGDNLSAVQKKLADQFKISMTYMDVRFLVDDLGLELKNAAPKADAADVAKTPAANVGGVPPPRSGAGVERVAPNAPDDDDLPVDELPEAAGDDLPLPPAGPGGVTLELDRIVRPGSVVSGSVTFSDGVTGKWALDQMGRLMLETPQKGYQPSPADVKSFQRELQVQLQRQGF
jgi:hypothetical protein